MNEEEALKKARTLPDKSFFGLSFVMCLMIATMAAGVILDNAENKDHKNVVLENRRTKLLVEDIDTKDQKILNFSRKEYQENIKYLQPGDTVIIKSKENKYAKNKVIVANESDVIFNADSVYVRKQREIFNAQRQEMLKTR